tara:strand:+ start:200 stop:385 length:186 start_codon:yes stop_codon:yes gene_type:complete
MPKTEFNIEVTHQEIKTFNVKADTWKEAVEMAATHAENEGLDTVGCVRVLDENYRPVDTYK